MRLIYLGSPYNHADETVRAQRLRIVQDALAFFAISAQNICIYSPIAHWSGVATNHALPHGFEFWSQRDFHMIRQSTALWILTTEGWKDSYGLRQEREFADSIKKPTLFVIRDDAGFHVADTEPEPT